MTALGERAGAARRGLDAVWADRRIGVAIAVGSAALWGLLGGWWTPRGPITAGEGLSAMGISLLLGAGAGLVTRSRWAMLLAPVAFVTALELARLGTDGPTVDGLHASTYGAIAFVVGRGVHGLLTVVPMVLGGALGAGLARRIAGENRGGRLGRYARRAVAGLVAVGLILLGVAVARPAKTDPIPGPGSVAELTRVEIGGRPLAMMIRGERVENPVLLFLAGGPGGTELGAMRRHLAALERDFVVVTWDQRGTGKSYGEIDPTSTLTLERVVSDTIEVTEYLRDRFGREKIYLVGQSWGSTLGVLAVQRRPELYHAFVGTGQMVSQRETDRLFYRDTLAWARANGHDDVAERLSAIGPPPYASILDYEPALSYEHEVYRYDHSPNAEGEGGFSENLFVEEYTLLEQIHNLGGFLDTFSALYPQLQGIDFRTDATALDVPVYLVQGGHEARGRDVLAREWFEQLRAPVKRLIEIEPAGHRPPFEQPARFHAAMTEIAAEVAGDR